MNYADLAFLTIPEIILTAAALLIIIIDLKLRGRFPSQRAPPLLRLPPAAPADRLAGSRRAAPELRPDVRA